MTLGFDRALAAGTMRLMTITNWFAAATLVLAATSLIGWPFAASAADEITAGRDAADYHMMFLVEHVAPPFRLPDDRLLTCTLEGQPVSIFRGDRKVRSGLPANIDVLCWPSADRQPEPEGPTRYYYEDPNGPRTLIVWANRVNDRLVAFDWVSLE